MASASAGSTVPSSLFDPGGYVVAVVGAAVLATVVEASVGTAGAVVVDDAALLLPPHAVSREDGHGEQEDASFHDPPFLFEEC